MDLFTEFKNLDLYNVEMVENYGKRLFSLNSNKFQIKKIISTETLEGIENKMIYSLEIEYEENGETIIEDIVDFMKEKFNSKNYLIEY